MGSIINNAIKLIDYYVNELKTMKKSFPYLGNSKRDLAIKSRMLTQKKMYEETIKELEKLL